MALINCAECQNQVSSEAASCPKCGAPVPKAEKKPGGCAAVFGVAILGFFILVALVGGNESGTSGGSAAAERGADYAPSMCKVFIEKKARDPDSIDYVRPEGGYKPRALADGSYAVQLTFRGTNGFGGKTLSTVDCVVRPSSTDDTWQLISLTET